MNHSLSERLTREYAQAKQFEGYGFRNVAQRWANENAIRSTAGSLITGGRYNVQGEFGALYLSRDWATCFHEVLGGAENEEEIANTLPRTVIGFRLAITSLLDLTEFRVRRRIAVTLSELVHTDWQSEQQAGRIAPTQEMAQQARAVGFQLSGVACAVSGTLRRSQSCSLSRKLPPF